MSSLGQISRFGSAHSGLSIALLLGAFVWLLMFGAFGALRSGHAQLDLWTLYSAGAHFLEEMMPYGVVNDNAWVKEQGLEASYYAYPPHFSPVVMAAALLPFGAAKIVAVIVNMVAAMLLAWLVAQQMPRSGDTQDALRRTLAMAVILASPFAAHVVWLANTSLIVMACISGAWLLAARGHAVAAGVVLALGMWKPQLAILPTLWFLLERRSVSLIASAVTAFALAGWHIVEFGLITSAAAWLQSLAAYSSSTYASFGYQHSFGIQDLVYSLSGVRLRMEILAFPTLGLLWWKRHSFSSLEKLALVSATSVMFLPAQDYDLVALAPLAGAVLARAKRSWTGLAVPAVACLLLFVPLRVVLRLGIPQLGQWRVAMAATIMVWLIQDVLRVSRAARSEAMAGRVARALRRDQSSEAISVAATAQPSSPG